MPESFQLERIFVKLFLRDMCVHFGQKYQVDSQGIKIYPVDDGENFKDWVSYLCSVEARKRDAPALVLIKLSYLGGISPE